VEHLTVDTLPELRSPIAVVAFAGWGDAAGAATSATRTFVRRMGARRFASIDAQPFYEFRDTPPTVRMNAAGERELHWPTNEFFYARNPTGDHDFVAAIGVEPNLRWRTFATIYTDLMKQLDVSMVVSLGALLSDVLHDEPAVVTGSAIDADVRARLDLVPSNYEGPTGISGVLQSMLQKAAMPTASLWANVPHYIGSAQNPPATMGLLKRLEAIIGLTFDYTELEASTARFIDEVNAAVVASPELGHYIRRVKEAKAEESGPVDDLLPKGEDLIIDIEDFLRGNRDDN
jgi:proteasome assembly chaperone (PAC2) family protein